MTDPSITILLIANGILAYVLLSLRTIQKENIEVTQHLRELIASQTALLDGMYIGLDILRTRTEQLEDRIEKLEKSNET